MAISKSRYLSSLLGSTGKVRSDRTSLSGDDGVLKTEDVTESSTNLYFTDARAVTAITGNNAWNASNWDTAFSWGNHASAGYLTSQTSHADVLVDGDFSTAGLMTTNGSGTYSITTNNSANWDTAFSWGNHAGLYEAVTGQTSISINNSGTDMTGLDDGWYKWGSTPPTDGPFYYASMLQLSDTNQKIQMAFGSSGRGRLAIRRADSGTFYDWTSVWTDADFSSTKISNWDTAYSWGNHASVGYAMPSDISTAISNLVDTAPTTLDTLNELAAALGDDPNFATTVSTNIGTKVAKAGDTMTGNLAFGDSVKATFGTSSDLKIYHDGSDSYIDDTGTGRLRLRGAADIVLAHPTIDETYAVFSANGANTFYYDNAAKLATTSTGIDVTGTVTADGVTLTGNLSGTTATFNSLDIDTTLEIKDENGAVRLTLDAVASSPHARISTSGGETIGFYDGTTQNIEIDGSGNLNLFTGNLKINGTSVIESTRRLRNITNIHNTYDTEVIELDHATYTMLCDPDGSRRIYLGDVGDRGNYYDNTTHYFRAENNSTVFATINGTLTDLQNNLKIRGTQGFNATNETASIYLGDNNSEIRAIYDGGTNFFVNGTNRLEIKGSTGNLDLKTGNLQINGTTVIDSNRNLTNIGSITATGGVLTISDNVGDSTTYGLLIDHNASGSDTLTADRSHVGLFVDLDSSASGGDISNEHRLYGIQSDVRATGDSDLVRGGYFYAEAQHSAGQISEVSGIYGFAIADDTGTGHTVNVYGVQGHAQHYATGTGGTPTLHGGYFKSLITSAADQDTTAAYGVYGEVEIDTSGTTTSVDNVYVFRGIGDQDASDTTVGNAYLFHGSYTGTWSATRWGLYISTDVPNYFAGEVRAKEYVVGTATVIDASRNLTNIGSVTSGDTNITSDSYIPLSVSGNNATYTAMAIKNTGSGEAVLWFDASNGDLAGGDYASIAQTNALDLVINTQANAGNIVFQSKNTTALELNGGNASFYGALTLGSNPSNAGALYINDTSTSAYTMGIIGEGTRGYAILGSSSSGNYSLRVANLGTGKFNVDLTYGDLQIGGTTVVDSSRNLTNISSVNVDSNAVIIDGSRNGITFEGDKHAITYNDGYGNFNIRVGNNGYTTNEACTEAGYIFHDEWSQSGGNRQFNISSASLAVGDSPTWRNQIEYNASNVYLRYQGSTKLTTVSGGVDIDGTLSATALVSYTTTTSASKTLVNGEQCVVTTAGRTITLPASPSVGDNVKVFVGNFTDTVIGRNGSNIQGLAENLTVDVAGASVVLIYTDATYGWRI